MTKYERLYTADEVDGMIARAKAAAAQPAPVQEPVLKPLSKKWKWVLHESFADVAGFDEEGIPSFYWKESVTKFKSGELSAPCKGKNCGSLNGWLHSIECRAEHEAQYTTPPAAAPMTEFEEAVAAVDNTLHHAIDHWQDRALKAEALLAQPEQEPVADEQEAWKSSDTAYRPDGLPQDFIKHEVGSFDDWSEWVCPDPTQYFMKCCDCGLIHEMQFRVAKYAEGDECEFVEDAEAVFRARRMK